MSGLAGFSAINEIKCFGPYGKSFANMCKVHGFQLNGYIPVRLTRKKKKKIGKHSLLPMLGRKSQNGRILLFLTGVGVQGWALTNRCLQTEGN